ncbi:LysR family transcriptional regulator [Paraburkholderia aspalathi]|nr:LysR family transcriptional regulator [Paraburkholderia aspalathi]
MKTTLDEMQTFIAVVDNGSITAAAAQLEQTISATSRALARLERKLQTTLLNRTTRRLELTEEGGAYLERARQIVDSVEETEEAMLTRRNRPAGKLRVDAATPFMLHVIVPLINGYRERYPQVDLELNSNEGITDLIERRTDVAIRIGSLKDSTLHATLIGHSRIRILASPEYLEKYGTPTNVIELKRHVLLGFSQPETLNEWPILDENGDVQHVKPTIRSSSGETLRQLALNGSGIVCLSDFMTTNDCDVGRLQVLLSERTLDIRQPVNAVYYRNTNLSLRITSFVSHLTQMLGRRAFNSEH